MAYMRHSASGTTWEKRGHRYVRREKVNGKWRYYYKDGGSDQYGTYRRAFPEKGNKETLEYKKSNDLFDGKTTYRTETISGINPGTGTTRIVVNEGKLTRGANMASEAVRNFAQKGKSYLDKLFKK